MVDREEEDDLQMALRMSLHGSPPEPKRSKAIESPEESPEARNRRIQRELRAAAAERRMAMMGRNSAAASASASKVAAAAAAATAAPFPVAAAPTTASPSNPAENKRVAAGKLPRSLAKEEKGILAGKETISPWDQPSSQPVVKGEKMEARDAELGDQLPLPVANQLFLMLFGNNVSKNILAQWSNQGIRFSSDPETCIGLVQHEGGPCGVLAAIQAFVLKYLIFFSDELSTTTSGINPISQRRFSQQLTNTVGNFTDISEDTKKIALVRSMVEILLLCGNKERAAFATLNVFTDQVEEGLEDGQKDEVISKTLEGLAIESGSDLQKVLRVHMYTSESSVFNRIMTELPLFRSRMGAMLFLISALLSRGLDLIQADRDDPSLPLVTAPFGHASQEIVNMLLCGQAAPNVFDGRMDLGGGMFLKGIPGNVEVGFLTLLESLNFCKVGQNLKCPKWPIWVIGSESHYTVLFALDTSVQDENELEQRDSKIRRAFDAQDQSGGGGFISVEGFHQVLRETGINLPSGKLDNLCSTGYIVWNEFWQVLLDLDKGFGGLKDSAGAGKKQFDVYHFNGIAKSVTNGAAQISGGETPFQRPKLCKLSVSVPPRWTQEEFLADVVPATSSYQDTKTGNDAEVDQLPEPSQHVPLVDCIRTRWPRAVCRWVGDPPSIV